MNKNTLPPLFVWVILIFSGALASIAMSKVIALANQSTEYLKYPTILLLIGITLFTLGAFAWCAWMAYKIQLRKLEFWHFQQLELNKNVLHLLEEKAIAPAPTPDQEKLDAAAALLDKAQKVHATAQKERNEKLDAAVNQIKELLKKQEG